MLHNDFYLTLDLELLEVNNYNTHHSKQYGLKAFEGKEEFEETLKLLRFLTHPQLLHSSLPQVEEIAKKGITKYPNKPDFYYYLVQVLYWSEEGRGKAELLTKQLVELHPTDEDFLLLRTCYILATNFSSPQNGLLLLENFLTQNGKSVVVLEELANRYAAIDFIKARIYYSELLEIESTNPIWNYKLALILFEMRKPPQIELILPLLETALESDPNFVLAWELKRDVLWYVQRFAEAITV